MKKITKTYSIECPTCKGEGLVPDMSTMGIYQNKKRYCKACEGTGIITMKEEQEGEICGIDITTKEDTDRIIKLFQTDSSKAIAWSLLRKETGLSLRQVADKTGISPATISRLERGVGNPMMDGVTRLKIFYEDKEWKEQE